MLICLSQYGRILANQVIKVKMMVVMVMLKYELKKTKVPDVFLSLLSFLLFCQQEIFASKDLAEKVSLAYTQSTCGFTVLRY